MELMNENIYLEWNFPLLSNLIFIGSGLRRNFPFFKKDTDISVGPHQPVNNLYSLTVFRQSPLNKSALLLFPSWLSKLLFTLKQLWRNLRGVAYS